MFELKSKYSPSKDQKNAIEKITSYIDKWHKYQTLWWVTGSWKTFTMANIINKMQKNTLIIAHNKTLAAQLAQEFKEFFPNNAVHYFVSYYDYYQPEAYVQKTDTYIEKESTINEEIDRLRHAATKDLLTRDDVIIVASVSCIYGIWNVDNYYENSLKLKAWEEYNREDLLKKLVSMQFTRAWNDFSPGQFTVVWDLVEIFPASEEKVVSLDFWWDELSDIKIRDPLTWTVYEDLKETLIFPAKHTVTSKDIIEKIAPQIQKELKERLEVFEGDALRTERLKTKVEYDLEMMQEVWYVNWIENYSMYIDWRKPWDAPNTLINYFWDDFLTLVDESHMTLSQVWAMYAWDKSRKENLVSAGFRLPSALENRPLKFEEFEKKMKNIVAVSATPWKYEIEMSCEKPKDFWDFDLTKWKFWKDNEKSRIIPQIMRPTWLLDPEIEVRDMEFMVDWIMEEIRQCIEKDERVLITTLTKKSSEELTDYLLNSWVKVKYLHSEIDTLERLETLKELREWKIDTIVWVNLLREWLDLPEVSRILILDAEKQWFLRSESSLIQIIWRAARNQNWKVIMYSKIDDESWLPKVSPAMQKAIDLTEFRRKLQDDFNKENSITPKTVFSSIKEIWVAWTQTKKKEKAKLSLEEKQKTIKRLELEMDVASANLDFEKAKELRDEIIKLKK